MARVGINGFEVNDTGTSTPIGQNAEGKPVGTGVTMDTGIVRTGTYACKVALTSGVAGRFQQWAITNNHYNRVYIRVTARPASTARVLCGNGSNVNLRLNANGTIAYYNSTTLIGTSSTALTDTSKWYRVEWRQSDGSSVVILKIDGTNEVTGSPSSWASSTVIFGSDDTVADTYTAYYDDYVADDAGYPGDGKVVLLLPASDNTRTNWTAGNGGTSNLFDAVNNLPPGGLASANETNSTNIESASNTGTALYIANMVSYATAGLTSSDTVNAIMQVIVEGEDIATGTKTGSYEMTQNPVVAATTFTAGADGGAHGIYNNASSLWQVRRKITQTPSVTVATTPLMKLVKTDTTTRTLCVCFMGIYVDYTPPSVTYVDAHGDGVLAIDGTAVAKVYVPAHGDGALAISGTGVSIVPHRQAHGDGALSVSSTAVSGVVVPASGVGALAVVGTANAAVLVPATAQGAIAVDGTAGGVVVVPASAQGTIAVDGAGAPMVFRTGTGTGTIAVEGTANADVIVPATGVGALSVSGTGAASVDRLAQGTGAFAIEGAAAGTVIVPASGAGAIAIQGVGVPFTPGFADAHGDGTLAVDGTAVGTVVVPATALGSLQTDGVGIGTVVTPGTGVGALSVAGSASPTLVRMGTGAGAIAIEGTARAVQFILASGVGIIMIEGVAVPAQDYIPAPPERFFTGVGLSRRYVPARAERTHTAQAAEESRVYTGLPTDRVFTPEDN